MTEFHSPETEFHPQLSDPHSATTEFHSTMSDRHARETGTQSTVDDLQSPPTETPSSLTRLWTGAVMGKPPEGDRDAPAQPRCRTDWAHQACSEMAGKAGSCSAKRRSARQESSLGYGEMHTHGIGPVTELKRTAQQRRRGCAHNAREAAQTTQCINTDVSAAAVLRRHVLRQLDNVRAG